MGNVTVGEKMYSLFLVTYFKGLNCVKNVHCVSIKQVQSLPLTFESLSEGQTPVGR